MYYVNLKSKLAIILIVVSIFTGSLFGIDKLTSENPPDESFVFIGLSNKDSSSCNVCLKGGEYYNSGCKRCIQDGIVFSTDSKKDSHYKISWSNDNVINYGDKNCLGSIDFPLTQSKSGDVFWVEIIKNERIITSTLYNDGNFTNIQESVTLEMCSNPTNLQYFRISNNDGQSFGNGGKILGYIDDIKILEKSNSSRLLENNNDKTKIIFDENFSECESKTCDDSWILRDANMFYVDTEKENFHIDSQISGTIDYVHYDLGSPVSDNFWILQFKMVIDVLEEHPHGKGILNIDPQMRQFVLGIPTILLPFISYFIIKNSPSKPIGFLMIMNGIIISVGTSLHLILIQNFNSSSIFSSGGAIVSGIIILFLGILFIRKTRKPKAVFE